MINKSQIEELLNTFDPVSLGELNGAEFMKRTDTKFVFSSDNFIKLLPELSPHYKILEVSGTRLAFYENIYFDSHELKFYNDHHRKKLNRHKVRIRNYTYSDLCFLEVKFKNNKRVTTKTRLEIENLKNDLDQNDFSFVRKHTYNDIHLKPVYRNEFNRITLLGKTQKERLTIDFFINFFNDKKSHSADNLVIAELKQERASRRSEFYGIIKKMKIYPFRVSKYCIGMSYLNDNIKSNRFKSKLLKIKKITSNANT